ncbi:viperin family antiviral radical SAM protein [Lacibacter sediminis]|uniref:S-adenosylmethionine-dependent nucleotide dehydratase n=1 Tax=Lacibacter sediminis TaxID=2760713 RepID=A0A7G5XFN1_9BACT|nr:viperin family antiviral radical SAM protein [Lacibacter sediminis]QNA44284.1 radical SAM protein [Lacibacter sediminis]
MNTKQLIPSVNFHLWEPCNMRCKFCFATFQDVKQSVLPKGHLPKEQALEVVSQLAAFGFEKITFAGGEPTLCPWLPELITKAKEAGMTTMLVTNGSRLSDYFLRTNKGKLDWIALSIDSLNSTTNLLTGRAVVGLRPLQLSYYKELSDKIKFFGYGLKINTVVSRVNFTEDMNQFIRYANPIRWKVFQVLPMIGQNDDRINDLIITVLDFRTFLDRHSELKDILVPESNEQIKGSYVMVDPAGRFFDNSTGTHNYSQPILEVGIKAAFSEVNYNLEKFIERGGKYDWVRV